MPLAVTEIFYQVMMIRNNPEFFEKVRYTNKKYALVPGITSRVLLDVLLAMIGIYLIIGEQFPGQIIDVNKYNLWVGFEHVSIFAFVPLFGYISFYFTKKGFKVTSEIDHNRFKIDLTRGSFFICMAFIFGLITVVLLNHLVEN